MAGRKIKSGERYKCGKLKPLKKDYGDFPTPETMLHRLISIATKPASSIYESVLRELDKCKKAGIKTNVMDIAITQDWSNGLLKEMRDPKAGYLLGRLEKRGDITEEQYNAGVYFMKLLRNWSSMAGSPYPWPFSGGIQIGKGTPHNIDQEEWREVSEKIREMELGIVRLDRGLRTVRLVRDVVFSVDYDLPNPRHDYLVMLKNGLDVINERI